MAKKKVWKNTGECKELTQVGNNVWADQNGQTYVYTSGQPEDNSVIYKNANCGNGQSVSIDNNGSNITEIDTLNNFSVDLDLDDEEDDF